MSLKFTTSVPRKLIEQEVHVNDLRTAIILRVFDMSSDVFDPCDGQDPQVLDLSLANSLRILLQKPDDSLLSISATFTDVTGLDGFTGDGTDGYMQIRTTAGLIDVAGKWKMQGRIEIGAIVHYTGTVPLNVKANLD